MSLDRRYHCELCGLVGWSTDSSEKCIKTDNGEHHWIFIGEMKPPQEDLVNHPPHYKANGLDCITIIEAFNLNFRLGNVVKYILRHPHKGGVEDLKKACWYLNREIEALEKEA